MSRHNNTGAKSLRSMLRTKFVRELLTDPKRNGTAAAKRAGYAPKSASQIACDLMTHPEVIEAIEKHDAKMAERYTITSERITHELALMAFSNALDFGTVDANGQFRIDLSNATRDQFAGITEIESRQVTAGTRRPGRPRAGTPRITETKIKLADKRAALVDLGKITGLFKDGPDITVPITFVIERTPRSKLIEG